MSYNSVNIPIGTRDYLFEECKALRAVTDRLYELFSRRGFDEVVAPSFEYYDVVRTKGNPMPESMLFKFTECTGRLLALRPDMTTPIARIAATKLPESRLPARLFYIQKVYRAGTPGTGQKTEMMQGGVELVGFSGICADIEMIIMAVDSLRACTDQKFHIEIGHAGLFKKLSRDLKMSEHDFERMRNLIESKNFAGLNDMLSEYSNKNAVAVLSELVQLFGGEEVLSRAEYLCAKSDAAADIKYLSELLNGLKNANVLDCISVDLGLVNQLDYYTGIIIRAYIEGAGKAVLSGGRYDSLIASFGKPLPANGFAVDIDAIAALYDTHSNSDKIVLHVLPGALRDAFNYMDKNGRCVISPCDTPEETQAYAERHGLSVLVIGKTRGV